MSIKIGSRMVGQDQPCFIIAEVGINHNGDLNMAMRLIDVAATAGCDAVKFQKRTVPVVYSDDELAKPRPVDASILLAALRRNVLPDEASQRLQADVDNSTNGDLKWALEFTLGEFKEISRYCAMRKIMWTVSPWDEQSVEDMREFKLPFIKIASASLTDDALLRKARTYGVPIFLSTGMSTMQEVKHAVDVLGTEDLVLLHTVSVYPADEADLNLRVISTLQREFPNVPIGYSGHEKGTTLSIGAAVLGACVIERHITLDRTLPGSDQAASLEPEGIRRIVTNIRRMEMAMGSSEKKLLDIEKPVKSKLRRV